MEVYRSETQKNVIDYSVVFSAVLFLKQSNASMRAFGIQIFVSKLSRQVREYTWSWLYILYFLFFPSWLAPGGNGVDGNGNGSSDDLRQHSVFKMQTHYNMVQIK